MKARRILRMKEPGYPSRRQFLEYSMLMGVAAIGVGALLGGCRTKPAASAEPEILQTGGLPAMEPVQVTNSVVEAPRLEAADTTTSYTIQKGDTLSGIAKKHLGKASRWHEIVNLNPGLTPTALKVGLVIRLPKTANAEKIEEPNRTASVPIAVAPGKMPRDVK